MKSAQKIHKILTHKIHQAPTEFFLRRRESECLAFWYTRTRAKMFVQNGFTNLNPKERKFIIMKILQTRVNKFQIGISGFKIRNLSPNVTKGQHKVQKFHNMNP